MKIIIPMSGEGSRFVAAGYKSIKPLIKIHNRPIIEWVLKMFSPNDDVTFICRNDHIEKYNLPQVLTKLHTNSSIIGINPHKKGPVYAVMKAIEDIADDTPTIISYCDYYMSWNYDKFKRFVAESNCDGSIVCYSGFHPHLIPNENVYASCLIDEKSNLIQIKEKYSYSKNKMESNHSVGLYYFKKASYIKRYFNQLIEEKQTINNEYYASLPYNYMVRDSLTIKIYNEVHHFCQWGTPQDLEEYLFWANSIKGQS
jgi:NDP-sugar pyrophosphorylase family protein